jgi:all-trans-retinol 13,14-reductase
LQYINKKRLLEKMNNCFDVIIVGSGAGGLTSGAFLSQKGYKVLVIEQHSVPGGYLHGFKRKGFFFDSAVYSIAGCGENGYVKYVLTKLGLENKLKFKEYNSIYKAKIPSGDYVFPTGKENFISYLSNIFPEESDNIKKMVEEMYFIYTIMEMEKFGNKVDSGKFMKILQKWGKKSYKEFVDFYIKNEKLKKLLYSMWIYCALPEEYASSLFSVLMFSIHIFESSYYIEGGCDKLARILTENIEENGGKVIFKSLVEEITIENDLAKSVKTSEGTVYEGKVIIANSSAKNTLQNMISDKNALSGVVKRRIEKLDPAISIFVLYIAAKIKKDVKSPFDEANQIFYLDGENNEEIYDGCLTDKAEAFRNFIMTEIPAIQKEGYRTFNIYSLMDYNRVDDWGGVKKEYTEKMLEKILKIVGDYFEEIVVIESGTPKTFYRYTLNEKGSMYGFENTKDPYKGMKLKNETGIKNFFLAGHWTEPGGSIYNAMTSGYVAFELASEYLNNN